MKCLIPFHIFRYWIPDVKKKTSSPLDQVIKKSSATVQQKWEQAGWAPQFHNQYIQSQALVSPKVIYQFIVYCYEAPKQFQSSPQRNGTVRLRRFGDGRFGDGRFGDEMWNIFSFGMSPKCKSSHCRREAFRRKSQSSTCPRSFQLCCIYCDSWCIAWIWKCHYCIFVHR